MPSSRQRRPARVGGDLQHRSIPIEAPGTHLSAPWPRDRRFPSHVPPSTGSAEAAILPLPLQSSIVGRWLGALRRAIPEPSITSSLLPSWRQRIRSEFSKADDTSALRHTPLHEDRHVGRTVPTAGDLITVAHHGLAAPSSFRRRCCDGPGRPPADSPYGRADLRTRKVSGSDRPEHGRQISRRPGLPRPEDADAGPHHRSQAPAPIASANLSGAPAAPEKRRLTVGQELRNCADRCGYNCHAMRHCLQNGDRHCLEMRWQHEYVRLAQ